MKHVELITAFCFLIMIAFLVMAIIIKDVINSKLFTSFGIILGTFVSRNMSSSTKENYE